MITIEAVLLIIVTHWIADFVLQTEQMARLKSSVPEFLFRHVFIYTAAFIPVAFILLEPTSAVTFLAINFTLHYLVDKITSPVTKVLFSNGTYYTNIPNIGAFSVIGFDQLLHYMCLFITFILLI